jgi:hypothetical protein
MVNRGFKNKVLFASDTNFSLLSLVPGLPVAGCPMMVDQNPKAYHPSSNIQQLYGRQ